MCRALVYGDSHMSNFSACPDYAPYAFRSGSRCCTRQFETGNEFEPGSQVPLTLESMLCSGTSYDCPTLFNCSNHRKLGLFSGLSFLKFD